MMIENMIRGGEIMRLLSNKDLLSILGGKNTPTPNPLLQCVVSWFKNCP